MKPATGELRRYDLVALPGDGIGPEVVAAARDVVDTAGRVHGFAVRWQERLVGGAAIEAYGTALRDEDLAACAAADAVLLGAVGGPRWDDPDAAVRPEQALFALRGGLGLYANLRPVRPDAAPATGHGLSTNIIESSLEGYLAAVNKLLV
ncbi:MAG: isocitrate/isopropylmalate family dehydrogenase, partial [Candidatus Limnocylindrales bacterium]